MSHPHALPSPLMAGLLRRGRGVAFVRLLAHEWSRADGIHLAAALAFYSVLSLAPFLLVVVAVASYALGSDRATHYLLDTRLMMAWARALEEAGDDERARYVAQRLREFRNEGSASFFAPCADATVAEKDQPFQCKPPSRTFT